MTQSDLWAAFNVGRLCLSIITLFPHGGAIIRRLVFRCQPVHETYLVLHSFLLSLLSTFSNLDDDDDDGDDHHHHYRHPDLFASLLSDVP